MNDLVPRSDNVDATAILAQLQRVLASDMFARAPVLSRFLRYLIEQRIRGAVLKEYTIGVDVFRRGVAFDPRIDTIVRVQARRLRERLNRYYQHAERADSIRITLPKGHYQIDAVTRVPAPREAALDTLGRLPAEAGAWRPAFHNSTLPAPRTRLVGRAVEVAALRAMLVDAHGPRLVTLTGPGGGGKTRLALEVGLCLQQQARRDVVYLRLASVLEPPTVPLALLRAFGLSALEGAPPIEVVCRYLRAVDRTHVLLLDGFEHLGAAAPLIGSMLDACVSLRVLATSRVPLHLYGECVYPVPPLRLPGRVPPSLEQLARIPAIALFVCRAAAAHPGFCLSRDNAEAVVAICRRFDGLPLGIELAAAQCRALTPDQLLESSPQWLDVAADNVADVPARQRSLRCTIAWSYQLLDAPEQKLLRRLSVFAGGFTPTVAAAVVDAEGDLGVAVTSGLERLRDHSLLTVSSGTEEPCYDMLQMIREFGWERLGASDEAVDLHKAHAAYVLVLAEEGERYLAGGGVQANWLARCDQAQDDFRVALQGLLERGDGQQALRLVGAWLLYWEQRGHVTTAHSMLVSVLERFEPSVAPALWARVACRAGALEGWAGMSAAARTHFVRAWVVARECADGNTEAMVLNAVAVFHGVAGRHREAARVYATCLRLCRAQGSDAEIATARRNLAMAQLALGDCAAARGELQCALQSFAGRNEWIPAAHCLDLLGHVALVADEPDEAEAYYLQGKECFLQARDFLGVARCWTDLAHLAIHRGQYAAAVSLLTNVVRVEMRLGVLRNVADVLEGCAALAVAASRFPDALVLAGSAQAVRAHRNLVAYPYRHARLERVLRPAREALARAQAADCYYCGLEMDMPHITAYLRRCLRGFGQDAWEKPDRP